jgi:hypothetical protein
MPMPWKYSRISRRPTRDRPHSTNNETGSDRFGRCLFMFETAVKKELSSRTSLGLVCDDSFLLFDLVKRS